MAMTVQMVIDGLRADIELGRYKADDLLVIDWFSYHDIHQFVIDMEDQDLLTDEEARSHWAGVAEEIDMRLDEFQTSEINSVIREFMEEELGNG